MSAPRPLALLVHAHPEPASFAAAQASAAEAALRHQGYEVQRLDLYALDWQARLGREDFPGAQGYFKPQPRSTAC